MQLYYLQHLMPGECLLDAEESQHCVRILRHKAGDPITVTDGKGNTAHAKILDANPNKCNLLIETIDYKERPEKCSLHIAFAPTKSSDRTEWFIEKATEFGVAEITFIASRYSERDKINLERYRKVALSAMKQSLRCYLPKLEGIMAFEKFFNFLTNQNTHKFIAHCNTNFERAPLTSEMPKGGGRLIVLIGPEGDFSEQEIQQANESGFRSVHLGDARLRAETAAIAVSTLNYFDGL